MTPKEAFEILADTWKYISQEKDGSIFASTHKPVSHIAWGTWQYTEGSDICLDNILKERVVFSEENWTKCIAEREPDYSKWIGKLCYLQDSETSPKFMEILTDYHEKTALPFETVSGYYKICRPLTQQEIDEITFKEIL